ncbi:metallophosphoesterase family protein [Clostridium felsineum]|uniref:3',5'-cyclic adenosine monophosphate phosphodiesterase CpdA n=1 Tax=Clostridium felsineum TaxID=36839 RepID=A0A1S8LJF1_9CLOT|nr:metallophosphoesterase [Clostridium felsineum]MCR3760101.1 phosphohydrolase [Clostridium felsineum]URZ01357.1 3',5'-cyclic adenosine monophosphate phosphodiesterase CpdA [Clostridium felsineum]URZ05806.1 3',5'-cyclic adenosine monophosphate phosphodiesterase CpdA [Clostridium felsineum]URZ10845.1 3',5'-cyclic adenosine monophosphate phosphodiesterase CpdA [Clostridium felsineum]URZ15587.1 3',5'-cyclic adenosine monophosphate phosphodiesterase CpdA [Clostridium felsineum DSM 794]
MNKKRGLLSFLITTITALSVFSVAAVKANAQYEFDVISDTHIGSDDMGGWHATRNLKTTLNCIAKYHSNDQCVVFNGDNVDTAYQDSYDQLYNTIAQVKNDLSSQGKTIPYMYFNIGNHEYCFGGTNTGNYQTCLNNFNYNTNRIRSMIGSRAGVTDTNRANSYDLQYINNKNDRLAFLGTDELPSNPCDAYLAPSQIDWLNSTIIKNKNEWTTSSRGKKPMFVFLHQPLQNTVYGSDPTNPNFADWGTLLNTDTLKQYALRTNHPEVIMFTGHTHRDFDGSYYGDSENFCTLTPSYSSVFGVPSIGNTDGDPEGYHVTVYSDGVVVQGVKYTSSGTVQVNTRTINF